MNQVSFPKEIMIEATNNCNLRCFFCGSTASERKRGFINADLALRLIKEAYGLGCRRISFHGMGEPFLCKDLPLFVGAAKDMGYEYIYLDSNGVLASPGIIENVLNAGLNSIKFSIHATSAETYSRITNNDCFEKVYENAKYMSHYITINHIKCRTIAYLALSTINENEAKQFDAMMKPYFSEIWIRPIHNGCGVKPENKNFAVAGADVTAIKELPCPELFNRMIINWEGKAIACCTDWTGALIYGDATKDSLDEIWNNQIMSNLRGLHQSHATLPPICRSCMCI